MSELSDRVHEECTFKPKINKMSQSMPTRSWRELSEGDTKRLHQVHQGLKQERDGYENEIFTFKPKINASPGVQSRLKVSSDPHNYVQRLEHENKMQQRQQLMRSQVPAPSLYHLSSTSSSSCTFTHVCMCVYICMQKC
jgi:hypothetical protein